MLMQKVNLAYLVQEKDRIIKEAITDKCSNS